MINKNRLIHQRLRERRLKERVGSLSVEMQTLAASGAMALLAAQQQDSAKPSIFPMPPLAEASVEQLKQPVQLHTCVEPQVSSEPVRDMYLYDIFLFNS